MFDVSLTITLIFVQEITQQENFMHIALAFLRRKYQTSSPIFQNLMKKKKRSIKIFTYVFLDSSSKKNDTKCNY